MPIITNQGQQGTPPSSAQASTSLPTRVQSTMTSVTPPTAVPTPKSDNPVIAPPPVVKTPTVNIDEDLDDFDDIDGTDEEMSTPTPATGAKQQLSLSRMSEEERRKVIGNVFVLVLGRSPADRDFSYYRFSTLTEDGLIKSLLNLPEHKKLVEKANEHTSLKQSVMDLDLQVKQLSESMNSMKEELITMQDLLVEKNRYIQQMRGVPEANIAPAPAQPNNVVVNTQPTSTTPAKVPTIETKKLPGPFDELKNMVKGIFSK
ncbi:MAG: hypothetical protein ACOYT9_02330 [Patescibacteria group bacterium]|jgi:hypothetical protein